jgi:hypothetical protein
MKPRVSLRDALEDEDLLKHVMAGDSWRPHRILSIAAMGEALTDEERIVFKQFTGRDREPGVRCSEFCTIAGRRTGKSVTKAMNATYLAACCDYSDVLIRGEVGVLLCLAQDQRVAGQLLNFIEENLNGSPILKQLIVNRTADAIELKNRIRIEVRPASSKKLRGPTYIAIIADELSFWYVEEFYQNPDVEVLAAARPGLLTTRGMLITASSPYAKRGVLWDTYRRHYGPDGSPSVLVAKGTTAAFNPTIPAEEIERELERDPVRNTAEYLAEFRDDVTSFVSPEVVRQCTIGVTARPPSPHITFSAFCDPSGGSADSMTLAVGHFDSAKQVVIVDCLLEQRVPFSPELCVRDFSLTLKAYGVRKVIGDRYAAQWPVEQFARFDIEYEQSAAPKSDLYAGLLALLNSRRIELVDNPRLAAQLCSLERRTARGGRDSIDHPPGGMDDLANACAGLASILTQQPADYLQLCRAFNGTSSDDPDGTESWRRLRRNLYYESGGTFDLMRR